MIGRQRLLPLLRGSRLLPWVCLLLAAAALVAARDAGAAPASMTVNPLTVSPNGDGKQDAARITIKLSAAARVSLTVTTTSGKKAATVFKNRALKRGTSTVTWKALRKGQPLANGAYVLRLQARAGAKRWKASAPVAVDTIAPRIVAGDEIDHRFAAGGGLQLAIPYDLADQTTSSVGVAVYEVVDDKGTLGAEVARTTPQAASAQGVLAWDGRSDAGTLVPFDVYAVQLVATDAGGNAAMSAPVPVIVFAPRTAHGTVRARGGAPVEGVTVKVADTTLEAVTGADGSFVLEGCPMGRRSFVASKPGEPTTTFQARVNYKDDPVEIVLGSSSQQRVTANLVTISGRFRYAAQDGTTLLPMKDIEIRLRDRVYGPTGVYLWTDEIGKSRTNALGYFSFQYDPDGDDFEEWNYSDIQISAEARDAEGKVVEVKPNTLSLYPTEFEPSDDLGSAAYWDDNTQDRTGLDYVDRSADRGCWNIVESIDHAHFKWRSLLYFGLAWDRPLIQVIYPVDLPDGAMGGFRPNDNRIEIDQAGVWDPEVMYHEYGHSVLFNAYIAGNGQWIYAAYSQTRGLANTYANGRWYTSKSNKETYASFESEEEEWMALREGFAEFFVGAVNSNDVGHMECDFEWPTRNDNKVIHSASRVLWDLFDNDDTPLLLSWLDPPMQYDRPPGLYGTGDDDRLQGVGSPFSWNLTTGVWHVLDEHWPCSVKEMADYLRGHQANGDLNMSPRGLDGILYRMGMRQEIQENLPVVRHVVVTGEKDGDAYPGPLTLWCAVTDGDTVHPGERDEDRLWARFLFKYKVPSSGTYTHWNFVGWALEETTERPPGYGSSYYRWFKTTWDPALPSPVEMVPIALAPGQAAGPGYQSYAFDAPRFRVEGYIGAVAFDGLAESSLNSSLPIIIDTSGASGAKADTGGEYIRYDWDVGVLNPEGTFELWYKPASQGSSQRVAPIGEITFRYSNVSDTLGSRAAVMSLSGGGGVGVKLMLNEYDGGGPGEGTQHTLWSQTILQPGVWYHIAGQWGSRGMRLYINGKLEQKDIYLGGPMTDWSDGTQAYGAVSLGCFETLYLPPVGTAKGRYKEFRLSDVQRYSGDFTPASTFTNDADTDILDHLNGSTIGENHGFKFGS